MAGGTLPQPGGVHLTSTAGTQWRTRYDSESGGMPKGGGRPSTRRARSRSPATRRIGQLPKDMEQVQARSEALEALRQDVYTPSIRRVVAEKLRTIGKALSYWGLELLPPSTSAPP